MRDFKTDTQGGVSTPHPSPTPKPPPPTPPAPGGGRRFLVWQWSGGENLLGWSRGEMELCEVIPARYTSFGHSSRQRRHDVLSTIGRLFVFYCSFPIFYFSLFVFVFE